MSYRKIGDLGYKGPLQINDPLTYCLIDTVEVPFAHGASNAVIYGPKSAQCQRFSSQYCSQEWSAACEFMSKNTSLSAPNMVYKPSTYKNVLTLGEMLIRNTASVKYLKKMNGGMCKLKTEAFDPVIAASPTVSYWQGDDACKPEFTITNTETIDSDPVMNKILDKPYIGFDILMNIQDTMRREGRLALLDNTRLGVFLKYVDARKFQLGCK